MTTRRDILQRIAVPLVPLYGEREARSIALLAASELSGLPETAFLTDPQAEIVVDGLDAIIEQLTAGRPVQYVIGTAEFLGQQFVVREGVLIPRPETEELVTWILREERQATSILDVGTGSGCIAATLAMELPHTDVSAADISEDALAVAAENCRRLGVRVDLRRADALNDLTEVFTGPFDIIVSNPPYVPQSDRATMHPNVRDHEPAEALFVPDDDPLRFYRVIAQAGRKLLRAGGRLYFEIYYQHADAMRTLCAEEGYTDIRVREDLFGRPRMLGCRMQ
ncbi:MAG: peptide chain release factor N(5)-glutamine methyltransferase [Alistipes sp.]|jgi:release factor glutamine methyltransferase